MLRAIHVISELAAHNGGPFYSVPRLRLALIQAGCSVELLTVGNPVDTPSDLVAKPHAHALRSIPVLSDLRMSPGLKGALAEAARSADVIHNHGLWLMPNVYAGLAAKKANKALVVSPRGMLAPAALQFSTLKKKTFWAALQKKSFEKQAVWHATSTAEAEDIRAFGLTAPIAIIPNGIDVPEYLAKHPDHASQMTLLFISRLNAIKGLKNLIEAWSRLEADRPEWRLLIAGPDEGRYRAGLEAQAAQCGCKRITFTGPVYGQDKAELLINSDLFVLPTQNENFGLVVGEALAAGIPAIVTKGAPWQGLETEDCGWWIDHGVDPLLAALKTATSLPPSARKEMGLRGRAWVERDFSWDAIGKQTIEMYNWLLDRGERPDFVI